MKKDKKFQKFEILEHTADLRLRVFGSSPKKLFENALYAMAYVQKKDIVEQSAVGKLLGRIKRRQISEDLVVESMDYNTLLIDFLNEVLSLSDAQNAVFFKVKFSKFSETGIEAKVYGVKVDDFDEDIKAVTYHEVDVKKLGSGRWETLLVFDI